LGSIPKKTKRFFELFEKKLYRLKVSNIFVIWDKFESYLTIWGKSANNLRCQRTRIKNIGVRYVIGENREISDLFIKKMNKKMATIVNIIDSYLH
jgi:hypothetical protein